MRLGVSLRYLIMERCGFGSHHHQIPVRVQYEYDPKRCNSRRKYSTTLYDFV
jgi:hypothetical protein